MSTVYDFDRQEESDISKVVPKLKGESNFSQWRLRLYMALRENNKIYVDLLNGDLTEPTPSVLADVSPDVVREVLIHRASNAAFITDNVVPNVRCCNLIFSTLDAIPASHVQSIENAFQCYAMLRAEYESSSWQGNFRRFEVLDNIQYKNNPQDFVRRFKDALFEIHQRESQLSPNMILNFFVKAIHLNPRCQVFIQNLNPDLNDPNFLAKVYSDFIMTEGSNRIANVPSTSYSANATQTSSSNENTTCKNKSRGGGRGRSGDAQKNNKDKDKEKKKRPEREEDAIWCKVHNTLGNHYTRNCPLLKGTSASNAVYQPSPNQPPQSWHPYPQVTVPQPGQIIGQVDNQGRVIAIQPQPPRSQVNAIYTPHPRSLPAIEPGNAQSAAPAPRSSAPSGDPLLRYEKDSLFCSALFNDTLSSFFVSPEGLAADTGDDTAKWMIDSGTSTHMTPHRSVFVNFRQCVLPVRTATGEVFYTEGYGDVILQLLDQHKTGSLPPLTLKKVWLAPELKSNLISMSALDSDDIATWTKNGYMTFLHQDSTLGGPESVVGNATREGEHYWLNCYGVDKVDSMLRCNLVTGSQSSVFAVKKTTPISVDLAHRRACHAGEDRVRKMETHGDGIALKPGTGVTFPCTPCIKGKGHALPFGKVRSIRSRPGELLHLDVWGPISIASHGGEHYFVTFTNDATRYTWLFLLKSRAEVTEKFISLESYLRTQFNYVVKRVHGDDAPEHKPLDRYLKSRGVVWDPTPPYTQQLNGVSEIKNRHLVEPLVAIMSEYQLPKYLWGYLLGGVTYTMNRLYASRIGMSPYEALYGKKPDLSNLRALGCQCWHLIPNEKRATKLDPHMDEARFIAYDEGDSYVLYNIRTKKIVRSRHVIFNENPAPKDLPDPAYDLNIADMGSRPEGQPSLHGHVPIDFLNDLDHHGMPRTQLDDADSANQGPVRTHIPTIPVRFGTPPPPTVEDTDDTHLFAPASPPLRASDPAVLRENPTFPTAKHHLSGIDRFGRTSLARGQDDSYPTMPHPPATEAAAPAHPRVSPQTPTEVPQQDHFFSDPAPADSPDPPPADSVDPGDPPTLRRSTRLKKPSQAYLDSVASRSFFDSNVLQLLTSSPDILLNLFSAVTAKGTSYAPSKLKPTDIGFEPNNWKEAMNFFSSKILLITNCVEKDKWLVAAHKELARHNLNGTWRLLPRTKAKGRKPLTLRWVFKIKHDGTYKARLVARGFRQIKDQDFHEVYAVVAKPMSFKLFVAIAASKGWPIHHVDITTAFLYAELKEPIEIKLPEGQQEEHPGFIGLLEKTIYGLKQSPREWYHLLHDVLISMGFVRTQSDHSVFIRKEDDLYVMVYVDDLLVLFPSEDTIRTFRTAISRHFDISDKGALERYLAINVHYGRHGEILLSQSDYVDHILTRFGLENCNPVATPMDERTVLTPFDDGTATKAQVKEYQTKVGTLIWLMISTRPDLSFVTIKLARHARNPGEAHFLALKRVFRYLAGTKNLTLTFFPASTTAATASSGANTHTADPALCGYCDADWAGPHSEKGLSTSGFVFMMAGGPISWTSKKQPCVALSTTESEYIAEALAVQEALWLTQLLLEIGIEGFLKKPIPIYADNNGAIALASNPEFHAATKHIAIRFHRLRDEVAAGSVRFVKIPTAQMAADGLTKPLAKIMFRRWISQIGLHDNVGG
ncbi:Reverse transcriptase RNA-dependent DNA polymerase [Penicillium bovifimosum]|uniref:Reverse transcriptase RNA-dependent DNA polymerase n=1 Tax=Penicillium bovifimosum TaxID=126998 RepID=A0A9W9KXQ8_9EURO|nr:Reverse transcriptase RNA-dependent DNA polymerase [Penicillium bovifimosum]KAJ5124616.1 Reverse transcriptase RNA-dependent DNA polymerase [Penicillium bovifimosum]